MSALQGQGLQLSQLPQVLNEVPAFVGQPNVGPWKSLLARGFPFYIEFFSNLRRAILLKNYS